MISNLEIRKFQRVDSIRYGEWFSDFNINKYIGPVWSAKELDEIEMETESEVLSVFLENELVGVVSVAYPNNEHPRYCIMGIAVAPNKQREGIGEGILQALPNYFKTAPSQRWIAYVSSQNIPARNFFIKHGWKKGLEERDLYEFISNPERALAKSTELTSEQNET